MTRPVLFTLAFLLLGLCWSGPAAADERAADLTFRASVKYDVLCFMGVLSGDPFYVSYYPDEYHRFQPLMTPKENEAFAALKTIIKDQNDGLQGPQLTLWFSVLDTNSIAGMLTAVEKPAGWRRALKTRGLELGQGLAANWSEKDWAEFEELRSPLATALRFLLRVHFEQTWHREWQPVIDARISNIRGKLGEARFLDMEQKLLGFRPATEPMTAILVRFSKPHGIRITGPRYITFYDYPDAIILRNAVHEPMHAPFDKNDPALWAALAPLRGDVAFMDRLNHHNPDFGYNTFEGLIEEDCVQAIEQVVEEKLGVATPAGERWRNADGGLHILAAALYALIKQDGYAERGGNFAAWLTSPQTMTRLSGHVQELADGVLGKGTVP